MGVWSVRDGDTKKALFFKKALHNYMIDNGFYLKKSLM